MHAVKALHQFVTHLLKAILIVVSVTGCHLIFPYETRPGPDSGTQYSCSVAILDCKKTLNPPQIVVDKPVHRTSVSPPRRISQNEKAYCDKSWRIESIGYGQLKGAWRVITSLKDNNDTTTEYLRIRWQQDIERLRRLQSAPA
jgi:hypothetical protein